MSFPILVRMDDICPMMNMEKFNNYLSAFESYNIKPLLGVIPDCWDTSFSEKASPDFWERIHKLNQNGFPVAMHGVHHVYTTESKGIVCNRLKSEFAGLNYEEQLYLLSFGKKILQQHNIETDTFMAPGHSYDNNTIKALKKIGFHYISDGRSFYPYIRHGMKCIPAMGAYRYHFNRGMLTICIHSDTMSEQEYKQLMCFIEKNKYKFISWQEAINERTIPLFIARFQEIINMKIDLVIFKLAKCIKRK